MDCIYNVVGFDSIYVNGGRWYQDKLDGPRNEPECREAGEELCGKRIILWEIAA